MSNWIYTGTNEANLMKIKYGALIEKQFNKANELFSTIQMFKNFVGKQIDRPVILSIGGGVGAGSLPTANTNKTALATLNSKKLYATTAIDRESMQAAKTDEGSFVRATAFPVKIAVESFNRNLERMMILNDVTGSGALIAGHASNSNVTGAGTSGDPYVVTFNASGAYYEVEAAPFEEGDLLNVNAETTNLEIKKVVTTSTSIVLHLVGTSSRLGTLAGANPFTSTDKLYMQGSKDNEIIGIRGAISATSSTLHGIDVGRRWQSYQLDAASADISTDLINQMVVNIDHKCREKVSMILCGKDQYIKILNLLEDKKVYDAVTSKRDATISFEAVSIATPKGKIPIVLSRFMKATEMFFLNTDKIELHLRPEGFKWFDEDGTVFLRDAKNRADVYTADYGGYGQLLVNPNFQGYLYGLAV